MSVSVKICIFYIFLPTAWIPHIHARNVKSEETPGDPKSENKNTIFPSLICAEGVKYLGCYKDIYAREFTQNLSKSTTIERCLNLCKEKELRYAGVQYGVECYCSNNRPSYKNMADEGDCNYRCAGDNNKICGGDKRMNIFDTEGEILNAVHAQYMGCYGDSIFRMLDKARRDTDRLTPEFCVGHCYRRGYRFAGLEVGKECYCGDTLWRASKVQNAKCSRNCYGEKLFKCGGDWLLSVYHTGIPDFPESENLIGCYRDDNFKVRLLNGAKLELHEANTPRKCMNICLALGFSYAGLKFRYECHCGNTKPLEETKVEEHECHLLCTGNQREFCGGNWRLLLYSTGYDDKIPAANNGCIPSETTVNGKTVCKGQLIFTEDFNNNQLDFQKWSQEIYMASHLDYKFVVFTGQSENTYVKEGNLFLKPTVLEEHFVKTGLLELQNCTGQLYSEDCKKQAATYSILPPIASGKISTKDFFSFKYGAVQIQAKLPIGDWIVPEILLEPKRNSYGTSYANGKVKIAMARGNRHLTVDTSEIGNNRLKSGIIMAHQENLKELSLIRDERDGWHNSFHNFTFIWTPEKLTFMIDNNNEEKLVFPEGKQLCHIVGFNDRECERWKDGSPLAPFDKEFYLSIGLSVGGMRDFPDGSISGNIEKPWKNFEVKAMANFWLAKENWKATWRDEESALQVDSINIYAL